MYSDIVSRCKRRNKHSGMGVLEDEATQMMQEQCKTVIHRNRESERE